MKKVIVSAGLVALGVVGLQNSARAQSASPGDTSKPWTISGTVRGFYDDNYFTQPDGPNKLGGYGVEVTPSVSILHQDGPTTISAAYYYDLKYYNNRPGNKVDQEHHVELALNHEFDAQNNIKFLEDFVVSQEPESLNGAGTANSAPLRANGDNYHNVAAITYQTQVTRLLGFIFGYSNNWYQYTGNPFNQAAGAATYGALLDRFEHNFTIDSTWVIDEETTGIFGYQFLYTDYQSGSPLYGTGAPYVAPTTRNNYTHSVYVGANHSFSTELKASARVGVQYVDFYQGNPSSTDTSPYANLAVSYAYMDGGSVSLGFLHSHNATDQAGAAGAGNETQDQDSSSVYATITQVLKPISPNLTAILTGSYQNSTYVGGTLNNTSDDIYSVDLDISYQFTKYLATDFRYNYDKLDSQIVGYAYDRNQVSIGVTASY